ncbi:MAG: aminoacyl-tRNA deacylase [Alcaligenaceae bacterium]|nr:MAG: aminoacyl-tRNA deacylase [Alcaligenaceae bacterium]
MEQSLTLKLQDFLTTHALKFERHEHAAVMTVAESELLVPLLPGAKTKNLFLRDKKGLKHFLVTIPASLSANLNQLGDVLGAGRLGFASAERLLTHLGVAPGSVSLLGLVNDPAHNVQFVIDQALWNASAVQAHPLINTATLVVPHADLVKFLAATGHEPKIISVPANAAEDVAL